MSQLTMLWAELDVVKQRYTAHARDCRYCSLSDFRCAEGVSLVFDAMQAESQFIAAVPKEMRA